MERARHGGQGPRHFRYRIVPRPLVGGKADTTLVGLEVEAGPMQDGVLKATRTFATLIPPAFGKGGLGKSSTEAERAAEAAFFQAHKAGIAALTAGVVPENQEKLNAFNCYRPDECCGFMDK